MKTCFRSRARTRADRCIESIMKRSGPIARRFPLRRSPMKRRPRRARPGLDDRRYLAFVRTLRCCVLGCRSKTQSHPHHITGAGMAMKANDRDTMPLCATHHRELHEFSGYFDGWTREQRHQWQLDRIRSTQTEHLIQKGAA